MSEYNLLHNPSFRLNLRTNRIPLIKCSNYTAIWLRFSFIFVPLKPFCGQDGFFPISYRFRRH